MQFLHPTFLFGLAALSVPLWIHFVFKMKAPVVLFPSVRFLRQVDKKVARRQKLQELLLLLLRCLALALLALGLAAPLLKQSGSLGGSAGTSVAIVLDDSYSMGALDSSGPIFNSARGMAASILHTLGPGDSACIVTPARPARMSRDLNALEADLKNIEPSFGAGALGPLVKSAMDALRGSAAAQRELYIVSDFQKRASAMQNVDWTAQNFSAIVVPVRSSRSDNLTLSSLEQISPFAAVSTPFRVRAVVQNRGNEALSRALKFQIDGRPAGDQMVSLQPGGTVVVSADLHLEKPGWSAITAELGDDMLPADNKRWLAVDARAYLGVLLCRPNPQGAQARSFYIEKALNPAGPGGPGALANTGVNISTCTPTDFGNQNFDTLGAVFMVECAPVDEESRAFLNNFVARGGGLVIVAGDGGDSATFNKMFARESDAAGALSPAKMLGPWAPAQGVSSDMLTQSIKDIAVQHPLFARLRRGEIPVDLSTAIFQRYARVEPFERSGAQVLARFANGSPAIVERAYGLGRVLLVASALHPDATSLPMKPAFLPLVHGFVIHLLTPGRADNLRVGDHVSLQLPKDQAPPLARLVLSPKEKIEARAEALGAYAAFDFGPAKAPGAFALEWNAGTRAQIRLAAVNVDPDEGSLEYAEPGSRDIPNVQRVVNEAELVALLSRVRFGQNLSLILFCVAGMLMLGEAWLANRLAFK